MRIGSFNVENLFDRAKALDPRDRKKVAPVLNAYAEINACAQELRKLTGSIGSWFRPSQTQYSTATIRAQATRAGYPTCLSYDLDSLDYTDPPAATVVSTVSSGIQNGSVVSLHFGHPGTIEAMPAILDALDARGLQTVDVSTLLAS